MIKLENTKVDVRVYNICRAHGIDTLDQLAARWSEVCKLSGFGRKSERMARAVLKEHGYTAPALYALTMDVGKRYPTYANALSLKEVFVVLKAFKPRKATVRLW